jgi:hypothetical protein
MASAAQELSDACMITMFKQLLSKRAVAWNSAPIDQEDSSGEVLLYAYEYGKRQ